MKFLAIAGMQNAKHILTFQLVASALLGRLLCAEHTSLKARNIKQNQKETQAWQLSSEGVGLGNHGNIHPSKSAPQGTGQT